MTKLRIREIVGELRRIQSDAMYIAEQLSKGATHESLPRHRLIDVNAIGCLVEEAKVLAPSIGARSEAVESIDAVHYQRYMQIRTQGDVARVRLHGDWAGSVSDYLERHL